ncbi:MAG: aldehyde ferredoxin oxidoreductase N-terminal domain-containing protein, partial [Eubacterium sp.]
MKPMNYIYINLTTGKTKKLPIKEGVIREYLGGKILAAKLLYDLLPKGIDPLSPKNLLIINTGLMTGTGAPSSSRFNMTFKNVMTGGIASSNCGGTFGMMLRRGGVDGLIIGGKAATPVTIEVIDGDVKIVDAGKLWGMNTEETQQQFERVYGKLVIGPAGENLVHYACAVSGERVAGRCGAGAVMGSKNLKAVVSYGTKQPEIFDRPRFDAYVKKWVHFLKNHPMTGDILGHYGSAGLVNNANAAHALPTHNFSKGYFENAEAISGETLADKYLVRNSGC